MDQGSFATFAPTNMASLLAQAEDPLKGTEKPAGATHAKYGIQPRNQRTIADEWNESLGLVFPPLLITKEQKDDHHRGTEEMIIPILREQAGLLQESNKGIEHG